MSDCMNCGEYCGHSHGDLSTEMILLDLIAELRATHKKGKRCVMDCCSSCTRCDRNDSWPCAEIKAADRAEARLREVAGDE